MTTALNNEQTKCALFFVTHLFVLFFISTSLFFVSLLEGFAVCQTANNYGYLCAWLNETLFQENGLLDDLLSYWMII